MKDKIQILREKAQALASEASAVMAAPFKVGDKVVDRGGYRGSIVQVTEWRGSRWYDVRIMDGCRSLGVAVRYDGDLKHDEAAA
jgi:hypothetical protein